MILDLVEPWDNTNKNVCSNYYSELVRTSNNLKKTGIKFIGVAKTTTYTLPQKYPPEIDLVNRGDRFLVITKDAYGIPSLLDSHLWVVNIDILFITYRGSTASQINVEEILQKR